MKKFFEEFKKFISRGNVVDLAVGMIMGTAFTAIVSSLVDSVLMPLLGAIIGGIDLSNLSVTIPWSLSGEPPVLHYGAFLQAIINFILIAFCIFLMIKAINVLSKKKEEAPKEPPKPTKEEELLTEIRDLLKVQAGIAESAEESEKEKVTK
ncbi:MAG: large-conductance mechanosensitive channel protein MscL [Ruminococcus sp.]|nr:large-conductance mechanosensitive channel protein MscL [Oscillospiraceae bacterium]MDY4413408.1 large-conductance mechanosensitive channel protein MscL [Ruminococcus sp.]